MFVLFSFSLCVFCLSNSVSRVWVALFFRVSLLFSQVYARSRRNLFVRFLLSAFCSFPFFLVIVCFVDFVNASDDDDDDDDDAERCCLSTFIRSQIYFVLNEDNRVYNISKGILNQLHYSNEIRFYPVSSKQQQDVAVAESVAVVANAAAHFPNTRCRCRYLSRIFIFVP